MKLLCEADSSCIRTKISENGRGISEKERGNWMQIQHVWAVCLLPCQHISIMVGDDSHIHWQQEVCVCLNVGSLDTVYLCLQRLGKLSSPMPPPSHTHTLPLYGRLCPLSLLTSPSISASGGEAFVIRASSDCLQTISKTKILNINISIKHTQVPLHSKPPKELRTVEGE